MSENSTEASPATSPVMKRVLRLSVYAAVLAATIFGVYRVTRTTSAPADSAAEHNHSAAPTSATAQPVHLAAADAERIGVTYAEVLSGPLSKEVRTVGQVTFDETRVRTISTKIDGWVEQLLVNETGQQVRPGQHLLSIYSPMLIAAQEELILAGRLQHDMRGATDAAQANAATLLESARRRLAYWDIAANDIADIERTAVVRRTLPLYAAVGGFVLDKNVFAGQKIMAGEALYKVADLSTVWIEGEVFEQDLSQIKVGAEVQATLQAMPGVHRTGRVSFVYPTLSPDTRTVRVRVVLSNAALQLKPGMYATLLIQGTQRNDVLTVPRSAVLSTGERSLVFVREANGSLAPREVAIGVSTGERIQILRGLAAGETVVASATFLVDAESNLGTALGGMGNMPGMEMTTPPVPLPKGKE